MRDQFILRTVALSQPKGKTKPLEIFTVLDRRDGTSEPEWLTHYEEGVRLFRSREFAKAASLFENTLQQMPNDWLAGGYLEKCRAFIAEPPPADWNAVDVMTSK